MNDKQLGSFKISVFCIRKNPKQVAVMLAKINFIPVRAEMKFDTDIIEYTGLSDKFDEVKLGQVTPYYELRSVTNFGQVTGVVVEKQTEG